jgi:ribosomal protein S18 acetylase RimI-like enzyme
MGKKAPTIPVSRPELRSGGPTDFDFIHRLSVRVFAHLGDYDKIIPAWLKHEGVLSFIVEEHGVPAGFFMLGYYHIDNGRAYAADLLAIAVMPDAQHRGLGRLLLTQAIETARSARQRMPVREMRLTVAENNLRAQKLFTASGFTAIPGDHGTYDGGQRAFQMRLPLGTLDR